MFSSHDRIELSPLCDRLFSSEPAIEVPKKEISPPSHSSNLKEEPSFSPHSSPPISERSPSSPSPSTLIPPLWETRLFSNSRSRTVLTRLIANALALLCVDVVALNKSDLWAMISNEGWDCDGGREVRACNTRWRCLGVCEILALISSKKGRTLQLRVHYERRCSRQRQIRRPWRPRDIPGFDFEVLDGQGYPELVLSSWEK